VVFLGWKCARGGLLRALFTGERSLQAHFFYVELSEKPNSICVVERASVGMAQNWGPLTIHSIHLP
jgi:hypothetical protein